MATITGFTATHMQAIEDATIVDADIDVNGHLIFTRHDTTTFDAGSALAAIPSASTTVEGKIELATSAEALAGTDTVRAITPATAKAIIDALILNGLADVTITSPATNDVLQWNGTQWVNRNFLTVTGDVTAAKGRFGGSGPSAAVYIGDDVTLNDVNQGNMLGIQGQQTPANGGIVFGSGLDTNLYRVGANILKTDDTFAAAGDIYVRDVTTGIGPVFGVAGLAGVSSSSGNTNPGGESGLSTSWGVGSNSVTLIDGYVYLLLIAYQLSDNINSGYSVPIPRLYTSGGGYISGWVHTNPANGHVGQSYSQWLYVKRVAGSNLTIGFGMTVQRYFSGVAGTSNLDVASVTLIDYGRVSDHPGASNIAAAL